MRRTGLFALVVTAVIGGLACGAGASPDEAGPATPATKRPVSPTTGTPATPPVTTPARTAGDQPDRPLITEFGAGAAVVGEVSSGAMERDSGFLFDLRPMTEFCSVAFDTDDGIGVITNADTLVNVMIFEDPEKRTYGDIGVGSTVEEVVAQFGANATVLDVVSEDGGPLVRIAPADGPSETARGIYFRTDTALRVTQYRVGRWPWVEYERYCEPSAAQR